MIDPSRRPPLSAAVQEIIESEQKAIHDKYWPQICEFSASPNFWAEITNNHLSLPIRQQRKLFRILTSYATFLFDAEAKRYPLHHKNMRQWLDSLEQEIFDTILAGLSRLNLEYHADLPEIKDLIIAATHARANAYLKSVLEPLPLESTSSSAAEPAPTHHRLSATVSSPLAARRMEDYLREEGIGQTEFAIQAQTTDRTLRNFRRTGRIRRDILAGIARAMGITKEKLIKD